MDIKINKNQALKALIYRRADKGEAPKESLRQLNAAERESIRLDNGTVIIGRDRHYKLHSDDDGANDIMRVVTTDFRTGKKRVDDKQAEQATE